MPSSIPTRVRATALLILALAAGNTTAASLSYVLDQSDSMPDDTGYLEVTISDGLAGAIDFVVRLLQPLQEVRGDRFGIQRFSFNLAPGAGAEAADVSGLPAGWRAMNGGRLGGFGRFDISLKGKGAHRADELKFTITGVESDVLMDYVSLSTGHAANKHSLFAARMHGVNLAKSGRQAAFGGISSAASPVPVPATVWLLGSALGLLVPLRRRFL